MGLVTLTPLVMKLNALNKLTENGNNTAKMPVLFLGHGSPMNAIEENEFVQGFRKVASEIPRPDAILCISAHWETKGTFVTAMQYPKTIHDFGGFPQELYKVQYPAPGSIELANEIHDIVTKTSIGLNENWGLDHGAWSVIRHMYPEADIPVIEMSLDYSQSPQYHYELAQEIALLRHKGVLIIGSGNIVHNLRRIAWDKLETPGFGFDWAIEANNKIKELVTNGDHNALINYPSLGRSFELAVPSPEHYMPMLYILALKDKNESFRFFNDKAVGGSLTMTSLISMDN